MEIKRQLCLPKETALLKEMSLVSDNKSTVAVCCGENRTYVLVEDSSLMGFGRGMGFGGDPKKSFFKPKVVMKGTIIKRIACVRSITMVEKGDGEVVFSRSSDSLKDENYTEIVMKGAKVEIMSAGFNWSFMEKREWTPQNHSYFSSAFRNSVLMILLCLREQGMKIPKFVMFEIIKMLK